jgi:hypothetical protein
LLIRPKNRQSKSGDTQKRARRADASARVPAASLNLSRYNYGLPRDCARARVDNQNGTVTVFLEEFVRE